MATRFFTEIFACIILPGEYIAAGIFFGGEGGISFANREKFAKIRTQKFSRSRFSHKRRTYILRAYVKGCARRLGASHVS